MFLSIFTAIDTCSCPFTAIGVHKPPCIAQVSALVLRGVRALLRDTPIVKIGYGRSMNDRRAPFFILLYCFLFLTNCMYIFNIKLP